MTNEQRENRPGAAGSRGGASQGSDQEETGRNGTPPAGLVAVASECLLAVDDDATVIYANPAVESLFGYTPEEVVGMAIETLLPPDRQPDPDRYRRAAVVPSWVDADAFGRSRDGEEVPLRATVGELPGGDAARAIALRAAGDTDCRERLETLSRITDELRKVQRAAAGADSRDELETEVCDRLTDVEPYVHAWISEADYSTGELVERVSAGDQLVEGVKQQLAAEGGPVRQAVETAEVTVVNDVPGDCWLGRWAERAADHGLRSLASVPLHHDGSTYGVLVVFADRPDAFDRHERAVLGEIGETVGLAISALERRRVLIADSVLAVEFAITGDHPLLSITEDGPTLILEGVVSNTAEEFVFYHTVDGGDPEMVVERIVEGDDRTKRGRVIEDGDEPLIELVTENPPTSTAISEFGGIKVEQVISDGVSRITAALPHGTDVRALHDALDEVAADVDGDVELLAQRTEDRTTLSSRQFKTRVTERLTDRQLATLRTAYFAGYHDRPRTSSGEDVAETLDVSPSTFHQHHRVGVRKLLAAAFERP